MVNDLENAKTQEEENEPRDPYKELAKAICNRYILDVLKTPPKCSKKDCLNWKGELRKKCENCYEQVYQRDKELIYHNWTALLFDYAEMERAYELLKMIFSEYETLKDFRERTSKSKEFWEYVDYAKEHDVFELACRRGSKEQKKVYYVLVDNEGKEVARAINLPKFKKLLTSKKLNAYANNLAERMLEDFLYGRKTVDIPYRLKVEIVKK